MPQRVRLPSKERSASGPDRQREPLLTLAPREGRDQAVLEASRAVIGLFLRKRTSDFSVKELAAHAGLSERTFYRYFPRKEDAIRPALDEGLARIVSELRAAPRGKTLRAVMVEALDRMLAEENAMSWENLLSVLNETESLRAVWLQVITDAEVALAHVAAEWLGLSPDSQWARLTGAVLATAGRLALEPSFSAGKKRDPGEALAEYLGLLGPNLFEEPASGRGPERRSSRQRSR